MVGGNGEAGVVVEPEFEIRDSALRRVINARFPPTIPNTAKLQSSTHTIYRIRRKIRLS